MVGGTIMVGVGTMAAGVMGIGIMDTVASEIKETGCFSENQPVSFCFPDLSF